MTSDILQNTIVTVLFKGQIITNFCFEKLQNYVMLIYAIYANRYHMTPRGDVMLALPKHVQAERSALI
jgi:hypothetical protein